MATVEDQSVTTINNLPDEILEIIIADLPIVDHAGDLTASVKSLEVLAQCCQNLEILELGPVNSDNPVYGDAALSAVFSKNQHLRGVFLRDNETITGTRLQALNPQSLEQLAVLRCVNFDVMSMRVALKFNNAIRMVIESLQTKQSIYIMMTELSKVCRCYRVKLLTDHFKLICVKEGADRRIVPQEMAELMRNSRIITDSAHIINEP